MSEYDVAEEPEFAFEQELKKVSITGRMAYALACVEAALPARRTSATVAFLDLMWGFVENDRRDRWVEGILPAGSELRRHLKAGPGAPEFPARSPFCKHPLHVLKMFDAAIRLGRCELFGAIEGHSEETWRLASEVHGLAVKSGTPTPAPESFLSSKFTENSGWGKRRPRSFYLGTPARTAEAPVRKAAAEKVASKPGKKVPAAPKAGKPAAAKKKVSPAVAAPKTAKPGEPKQAAPPRSPTAKRAAAGR